MNRQLLDKSLDVFPQNSTFFIQILMITLKTDVTLKSFLVMQFQLLFESTFSMKVFLVLNSSIRLQELLYHQIKARGKYKQVIKLKPLLIISLLHKHIQNDVSAVCIWSCSLETLLQFFTRVSTTMSTGMVQELQGHAVYISSEGC